MVRHGASRLGVVRQARFGIARSGAVGLGLAGKAWPGGACCGRLRHGRPTTKERRENNGS